MVVKGQSTHGYVLVRTAEEAALDDLFILPLGLGETIPASSGSSGGIAVPSRRDR